MLRVLSILYSTYFYFYLLYTLIVIYERYVKKEYNRFPNNLKQIFLEMFRHCIRSNRSYLACFPQTSPPRPDRLWTRLPFVNHASYRAHLHLNTNDAFSFSTLFHSYLPCFSPPSPPQSRFRSPFLQFLLSPSCPFYRYFSTQLLPTTSTPRFSSFKIRGMDVSRKKKNFCRKDYQVFLIKFLHAVLSIEDCKQNITLLLSLAK